MGLDPGNHFVSDFVAHSVREVVWEMKETARWISALFAFVGAAAAKEGELIGSGGMWENRTWVEQLCCWVSCDLFKDCFSLRGWLPGDVVD